MHVLTLTTNLRMPFMREYLLLHGLSDVSRQTCVKILTRYRYNEQINTLSEDSGRYTLIPA